MSLKNFSELFVDLDSNNSTNNKIEVLKNYFLSNDPIDNSWAIYLLTGKRNKRFISGRYLKNLFSQIKLRQYDLAYLISHYGQQEVRPSSQNFPVMTELLSLIFLVWLHLHPYYRPL